MVEVFKTNVSDVRDADFLIEQIHGQFEKCRANFDLEDCDLILRIQTEAKSFEVAPLVKLLSKYGFFAEVLEDEFEGIAVGK